MIQHKETGYLSEAPFYVPLCNLDQSSLHSQMAELGVNYFIPCFLQLSKALNGDYHCLRGSLSVIRLWIEPLIYEVLNYSRIHFSILMPCHPEFS